MPKVKEAWNSRVGLILAMAGNAVGLGNFLRFPVQAVKNGGGAFIIPYLVSFLLMGLPLLWIEWAQGRYGGVRGSHSTPFIFNSLSKKRIWKYVGVFGIFTNIGIISYYTYIESWTLSYTVKSIAQNFNGLSRHQVSAAFDQYAGVHTALAGHAIPVNFPTWAIVAFIVTLVINIYILSRGLSGGVEKVAKIAMPLLLIFGVFLAIRAVTLGATGVAGCATCNSHVGLDFLWHPKFSSLSDPKVWLAAAGQIFFTLSVGMGTIHCYASYVKKNDDIALNAMTAGWMNEFVEIVLGASIVIPIAVGYMGLDWVKANAGFMMAFKTMPYLFNQWGPLLATLSGVAWFGLLFIAGITSSLAMGSPFMAFMEDEFNLGRKKAALILGAVIFVLAVPTILFFQMGVFDEYDYWTGTVALVVFALGEVILFSWIVGIDEGWKEIKRGADIKIPMIYKPIMKWITPIFIIVIFLSALIKPLGGSLNDWQLAFHQLLSHGSWPFAGDSIVAQVFHLGKPWIWFKNGTPTVLFFKDMSRLLLTLTFVGLAVLVHIASKNKKNTSKITNS
jgi:NSS family neurotransmitter:Na+ symporter